MKKFLVVGVILVLAVLCVQSAEIKKSPVNRVVQSSFSPGTGKIPLYFIPNKGQVNPEAVFFARTSRYTLWLTRKGMVFDSQRESLRDVSRLVFLGTEKNPELDSLEETTHRANFFRGKDKARWKTNVPTSRAVLYENLYPAIDLKVYGVESRIEYDWIVRPGGNPGAIKWAYESIKGTEIDAGGNLRIGTAFGELMHQRPVGYQEIEGKRVPVESVFRKLGENTYGIAVSEYNRAYPLIIDPVVVAFSTYFGSTSYDTPSGIAVDGSGFIYITGYTTGMDFPLEGALQPEMNGWADCFVSKLYPDGSGIVYSTFLGGDSTESVGGIAVDAEGNAFVGGTTYSSDFPVKNPIAGYNGLLGGCDAFVLKLSPDGSQLVYSTYLGGSSYENISAIAVDGAGSAYVTGNTVSNDFLVVNPMQEMKGWNDAFVSKLSPDGSQLVYSTYLGGSEYEESVAIAVDTGGHAYVTGITSSEDFPTRNSFQGDTEILGQGFVSKLSADGTELVFSTYLGGSSGTNPMAAAVDAQGSVYIAGCTYSLDFPVKNPIQGPSRNGDGFVTRFSPDGLQLEYSTYLGGNDWDIVMGIAVDGSGCAYICGYTYSTDWLSLHAFDTDHMWSADAFVAKISPAGDRFIYSSYISGSMEDEANDIVLDRYGNAYLTGWTYSKDFPVKNALYGELTGGVGSDLFIMKVYNLLLTLEASREEEAVWIVRRQYAKLELTVDNSGNIPVSRYVLYRREAGGTAYTVVGDIEASTAQHSFTLNDLFPDKNKSYVYKVEALDSEGNVIGVTDEKTI